MRTSVLSLAAGVALSTVIAIHSADAQNRRDRFRFGGTIQQEQRRGGTGRGFPRRPPSVPGIVEAPTGFDNLTNGYLQQGSDYDALDEDTVVAGRSFNDNRFIFEEVETIEDGVGPVYNAQSCRECHQSVVTGGSSQIAEHRTGRTENGGFFESAGGSLIHSRATHADIVERAVDSDDVSTFRLSTSTLGDGFVEAISNEALLEVQAAQALSGIAGTAVMAGLLEAPGSGRIGRFGHKSQHASLLSFAADAYLNEMGITSPLAPDENTSGDTYVGFGTVYDPVPEPEDDGDDLTAFADFMRSTKAPPRGPITADVEAGEALFDQIGCSGCHVSSFTTVPPGTMINGGRFEVPPALGNKIIHPYSDFLLHDIGTGDGIPVLPDLPETANQMRTTPLWGLRTRNRLMHDGLSFTMRQAIERHEGQAAASKQAFQGLSSADQAFVLSFLDSL